MLVRQTSMSSTDSREISPDFEAKLIKTLIEEWPYKNRKARVSYSNFRPLRMKKAGLAIDDPYLGPKPKKDGVFVNMDTQEKETMLRDLGVLQPEETLEELEETEDMDFLSG